MRKTKNIHYYLVTLMYLHSEINIWKSKYFFVPFKLYGEVGLEGDKSRDIKKEFIFDFSYWSADSNDSNFVSQDQVCAKSLKLIF